MSRSPSTVTPLLASVLLAVLIGVAAQPPPVLAQTGVTGAHTWQIGVDNVIESISIELGQHAPGGGPFQCLGESMSAKESGRRRP